MWTIKQQLNRLFKKVIIMWTIKQQLNRLFKKDIIMWTIRQQLNRLFKDTKFLEKKNYKLYISNIPSTVYEDLSHEQVKKWA